MEKWLLDRGAAEDLDVTAGSLDASKLLIDTAKERQRLSRTRDQKPTAPTKVPTKAA